MTRQREQGYKNPFQAIEPQQCSWMTHYQKYLYSIAFQIFEWKNLPDSIDARYLEMTLHTFGFIAFYKDEQLGYIVTQGAMSGTINHYNLPTDFHATSPVYSKTFSILNYDDEMSDEGKGVIIYNNDIHSSTLPHLDIFSRDLSELKEIISVNQNAQKTPVLIVVNDNNKLSLKNIYNQYEGNAPAIFVNESFDPNSISVHSTVAPYVVDKLNTQKNAVWNEAMTFLGLNNANLEKKATMITDEATSNNEQILASANIMLKARKEACDRINKYYGLNIEVDYRYKEEFEHGELHDATTNNGGNAHTESTESIN